MNYIRVGVVTDIHANYEALKSIHPLFEEYGCSRIYNLGDTISLGAHSKKCLDFVIEHKYVSLLGNHDRDYLLNKMHVKAFSHTPKEHKQYVFAQLGADYKDIVSAFPLRVDEEFFGVKVAFVHYPLMKNAEDYPFCFLQENPTVKAFDEMCFGDSAQIILHGHKHERSLLYGDRVYCDVGSIGCHPRNTAEGVVLTVYEDGRFEIERVAAEYDREKVLDDMLRLNVPSAQYLFDFYYNQTIK